MADNSTQAKVKSGPVANYTWNLDYVMMFNRSISKANMKEKPFEVATVEKKRKTT